MVVGGSGSVGYSLNVDKGITTLAINLNLNSYIENIKNRVLLTLQKFYTFSKERYKHNKWNKNLLTDRVPCVKEK